MIDIVFCFVAVDVLCVKSPAQAGCLVMSAETTTNGDRTEEGSKEKTGAGV